MRLKKHLLLLVAMLFFIPTMLAQSLPSELKVATGINLETGNVDFALTPNIVLSATINFTGVENAYYYVNLVDFGTEDYVVNLTSNTYKVQFGPNDVFGVQVIPKDGYKIEVTCANETDANKNSFTIAPIPNMGMDQTEGYMIQGYTEAANGLVFNVVVSPIVNPSNVTFNFTGVENAYDLVTAYDLLDESDDNELTIEGATMPFSYLEEASILFAVPEGYVINITSDILEGPTNWQVDTQQTSMGTYYTNILNLQSGANGATFTITVSQPVNTVTFNFAGVEDAYSLVEAIDMLTDEDVDIDAASVEYSYVGEGSLLFAVPSDYEFTITSTVDSGETTWKVSEEQNAGTDSYTNILDIYKGADGATFTITVEKIAKGPERLYLLGGPSYSGLTANPSQDIELELQEDGTYAGDYEAFKTGTNKYFLFYSFDGSEYTFYVPSGSPTLTSTSSNAWQKNFKTYTSSNGTYNYMTYDDPWNITGWPANSTDGIMHVVLNLETGKVDFALTPNIVLSATINFSGVENAYYYVNLVDFGTDDLVVDLTSNTYKVQFGPNDLFGVQVVPKDGYKIDVTCANETDANKNSFTIAPTPNMGMDGSEGYMIQGGTEAANGLVFNVVVSTTSPERLYLLGGPSYSGLTANPSQDIELELQEDGTYAGDYEAFKIGTNKYFLFYSFDGSEYTFYVPSGSPTLTTTSSNAWQKNFKTYTSSNGTYDYMKYDDPWNITGWPANSTDGIVHVVINLETGKVDFALTPNIVLSATINFSGVEDAYKYVNFFDFGLEDMMVELTSNTYKVQFGPEKGFGVQITPTEGYKIEVTCANETDANKNSFTIEPTPNMGMDQTEGYMIQGYTNAANGLVFNVVVSSTKPERLYVLGGPSYSGLTANPSQDIELELQEDGTYAGDYETFKTGTNKYFLFYSFDGSEYTFYVPSGSPTLTTTSSNAWQKNFKTYTSSNGTYNYMTYDDPWNITGWPANSTDGIMHVVLNLETGKVDFALTPNIVLSATINFSGVEDAYKYVNFFDFGTEDMMVELTSNTYKVQFGPEKGFGVQITPTEGYKIEVTCANETDANKDSFTIEPTPSMGMDQTEGYMIQGYTNAANGLVFNVVVSPIVNPSNVTFNFTGVENAYDLVTAYDLLDESDDNELTIEGATMPFSYLEEASILFAVPEGYVINITSDILEGPTSWQVDTKQTSMGTYYTNILNLMSGADGGIFNIEVTKPVNTVTFNVTGIEGAADLVVAMDMAEDGDEIEFTDGKAEFSYVGEAAVMFGVPDGYVIEITSSIAGGESTWTVDDTQISIGDFYTNILNLQSGANGATFTITVSQPVNTVTFNVTGIEGAADLVVAMDMAEDGDEIEFTDGKAEFSYVGEAAVMFGVPDGYVIEITSSIAGGESTWTVDDTQISIGDFYTNILNLQSGANGATFTITVSQPVNTVTFNFAGVEDAYTLVEAIDLLTDEDVDIDAASVEYSYVGEGSVLFAVPSGYELAITSTLAGGESTWTVDENQVSVGNVYTNILNLYSGANGATFTITVTEKPAERNAVTFNFTGMEEGYKHVLIEDRAGEDGDYIVPESATFTYEYDAMGGIMMIPNGNYVLNVTCDESAGDDPENPYYVIIGASSTGAPGPVMVQVTPEANGFEFNVEVSVPVNTVTFNFTGVENAYQLVTAIDMLDESDDNELTIDAASIKFSYSDEASILFAVPEGYEMTITADVPDGASSWTVNDTQVNVGDYYTNILDLFSGANGATFTITISETEAPQPEEYTVTFEFTGIEDAYKYVALIDMESGEMITPDTKELVYTYTEGTMLNIAISADKEYGLTVTCDEEGGEGIYLMQNVGTEMGQQVVLALYAGADGYTFEINVSDTDSILNVYDIEGDGMIHVFNYNGIHLLSTDNKEDLKLLEPGFYIVNGKKIVIR